MKMINLLPKNIASIGIAWAKSLSLSRTSSEMDLEPEASILTTDDAQYIAGRVKLIRQEMQRCVCELPTPAALTVGRRIHFARDVQDLWYLRSDLMALLSSETDEREARIKIERITRLFHGLMPDSMFGQKTYVH
ncbi:hypothetical protein [Variovorax sp. PCZ-1]|uniref:hypothetical protein n=1 Tax=Variovorax sp. PCZ-1 TaxID=2835533 RepID=UPI001BCEFB82|nr:hypothetical protein [Variovorax sp. PCZ-1]MBS7807187.1 hypothetical protein [Variovorax sp. PCZ-1]